jgi:hypothetical protein
MFFKEVLKKKKKINLLISAIYRVKYLCRGDMLLVHRVWGGISGKSVVTPKLLHLDELDNSC